MDYLVYNTTFDTPNLMRRFCSQAEAVDFAKKWVKDWRELGNERMHAKACCNGHESVTVWDSRKE